MGAKNGSTEPKTGKLLKYGVCSSMDDPTATLLGRVGGALGGEVKQRMVVRCKLNLR